MHAIASPVAPASKGRESPGLSLSVNEVALRFGGIHALKNVSFSAAPGQITALIGPTGAGKTSVFNTISDLLSSGTSIFGQGVPSSNCVLRNPLSCTQERLSGCSLETL